MNNELLLDFPFIGKLCWKYSWNKFDEEFLKVFEEFWDELLDELWINSL